MHISELTVKRPVLASVISLFLVLIGIISYDKLTIREYPDIDKPVITVSTIYRGASAEIMERDTQRAGHDKARVCRRHSVDRKAGNEDIEGARME